MRGTSFPAQIRLLDAGSVQSMRGYGTLVGVLFLMAGCVEASSAPPAASPNAFAPPPPSAAPAEFSEDTGGVEGTVTDAELQPVAGAVVSIKELETQTVAAEDGRFTFSKVPPGDYTMYAAALGYESVGKRIQVIVGEVTTVALALSPIPIVEPFYETKHAAGMLACAVDVQPVIGVAACGAPGVNTSVGDRFLLLWEWQYPVANWHGAVLETHWQSNQIFSQGLNPIWEVTPCHNDNDVTFDEGGGRSPMIFYVNETKIAEVIDNLAQDKGCDAGEENCQDEICIVQSRMFSEAETTQQAADLGLTWQQTYENFFTAFYHSTFPEGFTAKADT